MTRTVLIVQARMGSTRLPNKVLEPLGDRTVLAHVVARAQLISRVDAVCIATTSNAADDVVAEAATAAGAAVFRGDEFDVLERYRGAAELMKADVVMRVTCDCPLIDPDVCDAVLDLRETRNADYAANNLRREWPHGLDCEAFTRASLTHAAEKARDAYDREHVTPWLRQAKDIVRAHLDGPGRPMSAQRWTLDYPEDLTFFCALFAAYPAVATAGWRDIQEFVAGRPDISVLNANRATCQ